VEATYLFIRYHPEPPCDGGSGERRARRSGKSSCRRRAKRSGQGGKSSCHRAGSIVVVHHLRDCS
jgi:hypothetical protein